MNGNSLVNGGQTTFTFNNLIGNPIITYVGLPSTFDVVNSTTSTQTAGSGPEWVHEIKQDGYRLMAPAIRSGIRLLTRNWPRLGSAVSTDR